VSCSPPSVGPARSWDTCLLAFLATRESCGPDHSRDRRSRPWTVALRRAAAILWLPDGQRSSSAPSMPPMPCPSTPLREPNPGGPLGGWCWTCPRSSPNATTMARTPSASTTTSRRRSRSARTTRPEPTHSCGMPARGARAAAAIRRRPASRSPGRPVARRDCSAPVPRMRVGSS
jgi:hypothetical protein